ALLTAALAMPGQAHRARLGAALLLFGLAAGGLVARMPGFADLVRGLDFLRDPALPLLAIALLPALLPRPWQRRERAIDPAATALLMTVLLAALLSGVRGHRAPDLVSDAPWRELAAWCQAYTGPDDRLLTAAASYNLRFVLQRTTPAQPLSAVAWVRPAALPLAERLAADIAAARTDDDRWDLDRLRDLARDADARWIVVPGPAAANEPPIHVAGPLRIYAVRAFADAPAMRHEGMDHDAMEHEGMDHGAMEHEGMEHEGMGHGAMEHAGAHGDTPESPP
ncbi:MAG: hypothetical protein AAF772_19165, partial [Acidobacteriota bacterium]